MSANKCVCWLNAASLNADIEPNVPSRSESFFAFLCYALQYFLLLLQTCYAALSLQSRLEV